MIIAGDTTNHQFLSKFPLQTFFPLPSLIQGFAKEHQLWQQKSLDVGLNDHAAIHRYAVQPPPPINRIPIELLAELITPI
ncbi:hypothetical protein B0H34DRAFT_802067 [Crassisporium funariophilum]|nr:hypothetical protein B0H34DRAFT_802067 [Crassisporium funariophilum]